MTFRKGTSGNVAGRPVGCKNKIPTNLRERVAEFVEDFFPEIISSLKKLDNEKKVQYGLRLLEFTIPKMKESEHSINWNDMSEDQLRTSMRFLIQDNEEKRKSVSGNGEDKTRSLIAEKQ